MTLELNVSYIIIGGHVEVQKYGLLYFMVMLSVYVVILCSNCIVVSVIWRHQSLHEPMYVFIAALLVNSVLFSTAIYPKLLIDFLSERQTISHLACAFQCLMFYSLGGAEFFLLTAMAYDRYVSICRPLQYHIIMSKTRVTFFLNLSWFVPMFQISLCVFLDMRGKLCHFSLDGIYCNNSLNKLYCESTEGKTIQDVLLLLNIILLPGIFILFTYIRILLISYRSSREVRKKAAQTCIPHLIVLVNYSCWCVFDVLILQYESDLPKTMRFIMTLQVVLYHPLLNPIIYGVKMKEIHRRIKLLFSQVKVK